MRTILMGLALLLLSLPVAAGEPCNAGSVDCCALEGTATGDIDLGAFRLTFDDKLDYITGGTNLLDFRVNSQLLLRLAPTLINAYTSVNINGATHFLYSANGALKFGGPATCTPNHGDASGQTIACGSLEVDGVLRADLGLYLPDNLNVVFGTSSDSVIKWSAIQTVDAMMFSLGGESRVLILNESSDGGFNYAHPQQINPTIFGHSSNQSTTEWWGLTHDQTDAVLSSGAGDIKLVPASGMVTLPDVTFGVYTRHHDMSIGDAVLGPDAPAFASIGTFRCASMSTAAKTITFNQEIPPEWDEASDMELHLLTFTETGDALANGEVIEFDAVYRSIDAAGNEAYDNGTAVTINLAETGGASEVEKGGYLLTATMPYTGGNQPLTVGDEVGITVNRDVDDTDTYSGTVYICKAQIVYTATGKATH